MPRVIEVIPKKGVPDVKGERTAKYIRDYMGIPVDSVMTRVLYYFADDITPQQAQDFGKVLLADSVVEDCRFLGETPVYNQPQIPPDYRGSWIVRVGYKMKPLIMDNWGEATRNALQRIFGIQLGVVRKIDEYEIIGELTNEQIGTICREEKLADTKVQTCIVIPASGKNG